MLNQSITISFIVPMYNVELYLEQCIESILTQDVNKEIILIDDGSQDNSLNIALSYARQYEFITIIHSNNQGQSAARNKGLKLAKGYYIYFVDSDDYLSPNSLSHILHESEKYQVDLIRVQAQYEYQNQSTRIIPSILGSDMRDGIYLMDAGVALQKMTDKPWTPAICWTIYRRDFLTKHNLFFVEGVRAEDQLFYLQTLSVDLKAQLLEYPHLVYNYRIRPGSTVTAPSISYFLDHFRIIELIKNWVVEHNLHENEVFLNNIRFNIIAQLYLTSYELFMRFPQDIQETYRDYFSDEAKYFLSLGDVVV